MSVIALERDVVEIVADANVADLCGVPCGGQAGVQGKGAMRGIDVDAEQAANCGRKNHRGGPELVGAAASERLKESAGENFGDEAGVLGPGEICVAHES